MKLNYSKLFDIARDSFARLSYQSGSGKALPPLRYSLELTYRCNLNCPYCYVGDERKKEELTTQEWFKIIDQIPRWGFITIVGGEPLIRPDFNEILERAIKRVGGRVNVVSNGILLKDDILQSMIRQKMLLLSVSIDGYGDNHDINRDRAGLFDTVVGNLENLKALKGRHKKPMLDIKSIILDNNLDDMPKLYRLCEELDADFLSLAFLRNNNLKQNAVLRKEFGPEFYENEFPIEKYFNIEHFKEMYRELVSLEKMGKTKIRWAPKFDYFDNKLQGIENLFSQGDCSPPNIYSPCMYPWSNALITPEGDMYPCLSYKIGNVKERPLIEVWNDTKFRCFRKNLKARGVFNSCQLCCELTPKVVNHE